MENRPFRGKHSGFLMIGEENAEYHKKKLISYYAKPFCTSNDMIENCITFENGILTIKDVITADGSTKCYWEQEDIESAVDGLIKAVGEVAIGSISCEKIEQLVIPKKCRFASAHSLEGSPNLKSLIVMNLDTCFPDDRYPENICILLPPIQFGEQDTDSTSGLIKKKFSLQLPLFDHASYKGRMLNYSLEESGYPSSILFRTADTNEFVGAYDAPKLIFLIKNGYIKLLDRRCIEDYQNTKHCYVTISIVLKYRGLEMTKDDEDLAFFSIPDCKVSQIMTKDALGFKPEIFEYKDCRLHYTGDGYYRFANIRHIEYKMDVLEYYGQSLHYKDGEIYLEEGGDEKLLTGIDKEYAAFCIDQYRECYHLPPIRLREG